MLRGTVRDLRGLGVAATALDDAAAELSEALELSPEGRVSGDLPQRLADAVMQLRVEARTAPSDAQDAGDENSARARKAVRAHQQEISDVCERLAAPHEDDVVSLSHSAATGRSSLQVAPLSVAGSMRGKILEERTAVLT